MYGSDRAVIKKAKGKSQKSKVKNLAFLDWRLEFGICRLEFVAWNLELRKNTFQNIPIKTQRQQALPLFLCLFNSRLTILYFIYRTITAIGRKDIFIILPTRYFCGIIKFCDGTERF